MLIGFPPPLLGLIKRIDGDYMPVVTSGYEGFLRTIARGGQQ
jgi:hypothetical protein